MGVFLCAFLSLVLCISCARNEFQYLEIGYGFKPVLYDISAQGSCTSDIKSRCTEAVKASSDQYKEIIDRLESNSTNLLSAFKMKAPLYSCMREAERNADSLEDDSFSQSCQDMLDTFGEKDTQMERYKLLASCQKDLHFLGCVEKKVHPISCLSKTAAPISERCAVRLTALKAKFAGKLDQDVPLMKACASEAKVLCAVRRNKISCLKSKVGNEKMSMECKKEVHRRKVEESEDIRFNKYLHSICALDLQSFCKDVPFGQGRRVTCLERNYGNLQAECKSAIKQIILDKQKDSSLDLRFRLLCKGDAEQLCPVEFQILEDPFDLHAGGKLKQCMRNASLAGDIKSQECREHMMFMMTQTRKYTELDPTLVDSCQEEKQLCNAHNFLECLRDEVMSGNVLSQKCENALIYKDIQAAADIKLKTHMSSACHGEHITFCDGVDNSQNPGSVISCLEDHFDHPRFSKKCRKKVMRDIAYTTRDIRMLGTTYQSCQYEISNLCDNVKPGNGRMIACLKENRKKIVGGKCRSAIMRLLKMSAANWKLDWSTYFACEEDADSLCYGKRDTGVNACLRENFDFISEKCKKKQELLMEAESESVEINSKIQQKCDNAIIKYCDDLEDKGGKIVSCLQENSQEPDFPKVCQKAIVHHMNTTGKLMPMGPKLKADCAEEANKICKWNNLDGSQSLDAAVMNCLVDKSEKLQPKCKETLSKRMLFLLRNYEGGNPATKACDKDVKKFCYIEAESSSLVKSGSIYQCLMQNFEQVSNKCFFVLTLPKSSGMTNGDAAANVEPLYQDQTFMKYLNSVEKRVTNMEGKSSMSGTYYFYFLVFSFGAVLLSGYLYHQKNGTGGTVVYKELSA